MRFPRLSGTEWRLAILLATVAAAQAWLVRDMRFLASGLFGGDHAYQLACIRSIAASLDPMASCSVSGALPGYLPLYGTLVAGFSLATGLDPLHAMFVTAVIFRVLSAFVVYRVFRRLFGPPAGLAVACLWSALHPELIFKYTEFTTAVLVPLQFLALHRYLERPVAGRAAAVAAALAALGYAHSVAFIGGVAIAGIAIVAGAIALRGKRPLAAEALRVLRHLPVFAAGCALALGYWWRPIFVHRGRTSLHYVEWTSVDLSSLERRLDWARRTLAAEFSFDNVPLAALTLLVAGGAAALAARGNRRRFAPAAVLAAASFAWMFHYLATVPALGAHFVPLYVQWMLWGVARLLLAAIPLALLFGTAAGRRHSGGLQSAILALALVAVVAQARALHARPEMRQAREEQDPAIAALTRWAGAHLDPGAVALSTNELSFAWSAITGRKTVVTRRGQNDAFLDMDVRNRDAALMLYGRDDSLRTRLLDRYRVDVVFWASNWFASEYAVTATGDTVTYDPFLYFRDPEYDGALARAGVEFYHDFTWVDPALRGPDYARFDLSIVTPRNYERPERPWRDDLDRRLERIWADPETGPARVAVFRVRRGGARPRRARRARRTRAHGAPRLTPAEPPR